MFNSVIYLNVALADLPRNDVCITYFWLCRKCQKKIPFLKHIQSHKSRASPSRKDWEASTKNYKS